MRALLLPLALFLPALASAAGATPSNFSELVNMAVTILNALTALMVFAALVAYLYSISMNIKSAGEAKSNLKNIILWGILGIFIMVSVWGILRLLQTTLFPTQQTYQYGYM